MFNGLKVTGLMLAGIVASSMVFVSAPALAGDDEGMGKVYYHEMSCAQLWYERNAIFARHGYCFKSERGINAFGKGCTPPYGKIPGNLKRVVKEIKGYEQRKGC